MSACLTNPEDHGHGIVIAIRGRADRIVVATPDDLHGLRLLELIQPLSAFAKLPRPAR